MLARSQGDECSPDAAVNKVDSLLKHAEHAKASKTALNKGSEAALPNKPTPLVAVDMLHKVVPHKENGGWGDGRDVALCSVFASAKTPTVLPSQ